MEITGLCVLAITAVRRAERAVASIEICAAAGIDELWLAVGPPIEYVEMMGCLVDQQAAAVLFFAVPTAPRRGKNPWESNRFRQ